MTSNMHELRGVSAQFGVLWVTSLGSCFSPLVYPGSIAGGDKILLSLDRERLLYICPWG